MRRHAEWVDRRMLIRGPLTGAQRQVRLLLTPLRGIEPERLSPYERLPVLDQLDVHLGGAPAMPAKHASCRKRQVIGWNGGSASVAPVAGDADQA